MIKHKLIIVSSGHNPDNQLNDYQFVHVLYRIDTMEIDEQANSVQRVASTGLLSLELDPWNAEGRIPGIDVTHENIKDWVLQKIDLESLQQQNIENLKPVIRPPAMINTTNTTE